MLAKLDDSEVNANLEQAVARLDLANQVLNRFEDLRKKVSFQFKTLIKLNPNI